MRLRELAHQGLFDSRPGGTGGTHEMTLKVHLAKPLISYSLAVVLSVAGVIWVMQLWKADLSVPFLYTGDAVAIATLVKSGIDNGWYAHNDLIGLPAGRNFLDYPLPDNLQLLAFKALSVISPNPFLVLNVYFLLTFPLITATSLLVLRRFEVSTFPAIIASLLFTFLPYHFMRGIQHIFLSAYYLVPLMVMVSIWVQSEDPPFFEGSDEVWRPTLRRQRRRTVVALVICALGASGGTYYAFFASYLILIAAIAGAISYRSVRHLISGMLLVAVITVGVLINVSPSIIYQWKHGPNPEIANRLPSHAEVYGLKISQLVLPMTGHRVPVLAKLKDEYNASPLVNENDTSSLGAVGSVGFLLLVGQLLFRRWSTSSTGLLERLSVLNGASVLLGTLGGFGSLFAILVSAQIRAYNRISVFIAFFSLFAIVLILDQFWTRGATTRRSRVLISAGLIVLMMCGVADQTSLSFVPPYRAIKAEFDSDDKFVKEIEASMPEGSMIFQLPYVPFPENPPVHAMKDYDLFRGYLHSSKLRWSYGTMRGREGDLWQRMVASKPIPELLETTARAGFSGVYIDRDGFQDRGAKLESELKALVKEVPLVSDNGRLVFFHFARFGDLSDPRAPVPDAESWKDYALHPIAVDWKDGFSVREGTDAENWRWSSSHGELHLINTLAKPRGVVLEMSFESGYAEPSSLKLNGDLLSAELSVNSNATPFSREIVLPPGAHVITFLSEAKRVAAPGDPRFLVFRINNFRLREKP